MPFYFVILVLSIFLSACDSAPQDLLYDRNKQDPIEVETQVVRYENVPEFYSATGYTNVSESIEISTSQSASIKKLKVKEGDIVSKGQLLVALDDSDLITSIKQAESAIDSARTEVTDFAHDLENAKQLRQKRVITIEQLRKASVQHKLAKTQLEIAEAELSRQRGRQPYFMIESPIKARVIKRWGNEGDLTVPGKTLLVLEALAGLEFETAVPAKWVNTLNVGDTYPIVIHTRDRTVNATINRIVKSVDRVTQTCKVKLTVDPTTDIEAGLSGQINFVIAELPQLLINSSALVKRAGVFGVFRVVNNKAVFTTVDPERYWKYQRVILAGLSENDRIITNPSPNLLDGMAVHPVDLPDDVMHRVEL